MSKECARKIRELFLEMRINMQNYSEFAIREWRMAAGRKFWGPFLDGRLTRAYRQGMNGAEALLIIITLVGWILDAGAHGLLWADPLDEHAPGGPDPWQQTKRARAFLLRVFLGWCLWAPDLVRVLRPGFVAFFRDLTRDLTRSPGPPSKS